ncbi:MAG: ABC transporter permease, partial [Actinomycetia bacterium]|nr:ABC transporter permease [Actinomycetes bacterium]
MSGIPQTLAVDPSHEDIDDEPEQAGLTRYLAPVTGLILLFGGWELYVRLADVRPLTLPAPSRVIRHVISDPGHYLSNGWVTLSEALVGFTLALIVALLVAVAMAHSRFVERATMPVIVLVQSTPVAVLAPVFLLWFGFSPVPKVLVAALFAFVPFVANALTGLRSVDHDTLEVMRSVDASRREVLWHLRLPHALPALFSAGRICVSLALVGAVIGELYGGSTEGLGYQARIAQSRSLVDQLWGSVLSLALIGIVLTLLVMAVERRV